ELIIVDDCSNEETEKVVSHFKDSRIKFFKNSNNLGAALTLNKALRKARGRWIAFLDSDDLWHPSTLEKQIECMKTNGYSFT
ncbi:glycosyltransferase family 2 protein, partial [Streptococcus suis]